MMWLTWRQFRLPALAVFGVLGAVAAALAFTFPALNSEYASLLARCERGCVGDAYDHFFFPHMGAYTGLNLLVAAVPFVVGVFWGAPLISREFEKGTQDLVWQQSVPRLRWLTVKAGVVGVAGIAAAGSAVAVVSWWSGPLDATAITGLTRLSPALFDIRGFVPLGHTAFAFALGAAAGLLVRRTVPAMAITFAILVAVQIVMPVAIRPHFAAPARHVAVITSTYVSGVDDSGPDGAIRGLLVDVDPPGAWILANETVDSAGRTGILPAWVMDCRTPEEPAGEAVQQQCLQRLTAAGYRQAVTYHPADRFWPFQAYETAIYGVLALLLIGFCARRIRPS